MNCKKIGILLSAYVDHELSKKEEEFVNEHLKICSGCLQELEYLRRTKKLFLYKEKVEPLPFFKTRLFSLIREKAPVLSMPGEFVNMARRTIPVSFGILLIVSGIFVTKTYLIDKAQSYQLMENYLFRDNLTLTERKVFLEPEISEEDLIFLVVYNKGG